MNRSTLAVVVVFVALLAVWLLRDATPEAPEIPPLVVEGYLEGEISLQDIKVLNKDEASPYRRYVLERNGERMVLEQLAGEESKKPSERKWSATRTKGGQTWKASGETYRVKMLAQILARPFRSTYAFRAKPEELGDFGLDEAEAVLLNAEAPDRKVALRIGKVDKTDETNPSTWVQNPAHPEVVYQIAGHDLRSESAVGWKDVRERKILSIRLPEIDHLTIRNPRAPAGRQEVHASRPPLSDELRAKLDGGAKVEDVRKSEDGWSIDEPKGYAAGDIGSWLESIERMAMTETYDTEGGAYPEGSGLDATAGTVHIELSGGGKTYHVRIGSKAPKGDQGDIYASVDGDSIVYSVANWSAEQVIKDLDSLRELRLLGGRAPDGCTSVQIEWPEGRFETTRGEAGWTARGVELDPANVDDFLRDLGNARVTFASATDPKSVGLDAPDRRITVRCGEDTLSIVVKRQGDKTWGRIGDGDVFTLQSWNADQLMKQARDFEDKHLLRWDPETVTALTLTDGEASVRITRGADGAWSAADGKTPIDSAKVEALVKSLTQFTYHAEFDLDRKSAGLEPAAWTLVIEAGPQRKLTIALSDQRRDNNPYAAIDATGSRSRVVSISAMMVEAFRKPISALAPGDKP
ncbi:MAG: hypothetical protein RIT45_714 [Pseudomonadota bacterium]|jgi:hypothetical protein